MYGHEPVQPTVQEAGREAIPRQAGMVMYTKIEILNGPRQRVQGCETISYTLI
jgi:hypothetical protein